MQQRIITLLCMAGMAISAHTQAASLKIRPNAPQRYVVKNGDTLWGISGKYLYSPWQWSKRTSLPFGNLAKLAQSRPTNVDKNLLTQDDS